MYAQFSGFPWEWEFLCEWDGNGNRIYPMGIPTGFPMGIPTGFPKGIPTGFPKGIPTGFPKGIPTGFPMGILKFLMNSHRISTGEFPCENP